MTIPTRTKNNTAIVTLWLTRVMCDPTITKDLLQEHNEQTQPTYSYGITSYSCDRQALFIGCGQL